MKSLKGSSGISLIALIITIIVIVILATIVVNTAITTPQSANFAKFTNDIAGVQDAVTMSYYDLFAEETLKSDGMTNEEIYRYIAGGESYTGKKLSNIEGATAAWKIIDSSKINGLDRLPSEYGDLCLTSNGIVFLADGYEYGGQEYITATISYAAGEEDSSGDVTLTMTRTELEAIIDSKVATNNLSNIYPVGSVYISTANTNPGTYLGGTWVSYGQGRTIIGAGTNGGYTFTGGSNGTTVGATTNPLGEYNHILTTSEMPVHDHTLNIDEKSLTGVVSNFAIQSASQGVSTSGIFSTANVGGTAGYAISTITATDQITDRFTINASHTHTGTIDATGEGTTHNNIQPYIVTYMWQRTE